jgi:hypothetical protein
VTEWFYKVVPAKAGFEDTRLLAKKSGFVCRSAHGKSQSLIEEVKGPALGDTLHLYFVEQRRSPRAIGAFEIVAPAGHSHESRFGEQVEGTAMFRVTDPGFASQLRAFQEYEEDPVVKAFTGWLLKPGAAAAPLPASMGFGRVSQLKRRDG